MDLSLAEVSSLKGQLDTEQKKNSKAEQRLVKAATALASARSVMRSATTMYQVNSEVTAALLVICQTVASTRILGCGVDRLQ